MKLKYYLRGLGIGIIVTTILLMIAFALHKHTMSDADIIARAKQDLAAVQAHMARHAEILRPKFQLIEQFLKRKLHKLRNRRQRLLQIQKNR